MEKLSELFGKICSASERGKKGVLVDLQTISEIRDEFWALKQRAEAAEAKHSELSDWYEKMKSRLLAAEAKLAELAKQEESRWNTHDGIARPIGVDKDDLVYLRMKRQEIKLPYPAGMVNWKHDGGEFDVIAWASVYSSPRPAPAADLAELVPDAKAIRKEAGGYAPVYSLQEQQLFIDGATWLRAAMLRKIEEAK